MDFEARFLIIRCGLTVSPITLIFADYFNLQAYLLKFYEPSAEYIQNGWNNWYLTLFSAIMLALSVNWLFFRLKRKFGAAKAIKNSAPFIIFIPVFMMYYRNLPFFNSQNGFSNYMLLIILAVTILFHFWISFHKKDFINV